MNKLQALHSFWSGFGLKAYDETSVPDTAVLPYITYEASVGEFGDDIAQTASLWYRSTSWIDAQEKEQEIAQAVGRGGTLITYDDGAFWLRKGSPWAQRMSDSSDDMIRRILFNIEIEFID